MAENIPVRLGRTLEIMRGDIETQQRLDAKKIFDVTSGEIALKISKKIIEGLEDGADDEKKGDAQFYLKTFKDKIFKGAGVEKEMPKDADDIDEETASTLSKILDEYNKKTGKSKELDKGDYKVVDDLGI